MVVSASQQPLLRFTNVTKKFGNKTVMKGITFDIYKGELFGLIGASGAGKTTLLRTLIGYYTTDSGHILYQGKDITKNIELIRRIFGFTTQDNCFYEELSPVDNMKYFGKMYGVNSKRIKENTERLLKLVGLWESKDKKSKFLSGGMQRRLDLAISLVHDPEILILDEPTTGLDPIIRKTMWGLIKQVNGMDVTIIMSSHLLDEMELLCDDVAMMKNGTILIKGSPEQLKTFYSRNQEVKLEAYPGNYKKILDEIKRKGIPVFYPRHEGDKLVFYTPDPMPLLKIIPSTMMMTGEHLYEIEIQKPKLEEVFEAFSQYNT